VWLPNAWVNPGVSIGDNVVVAAMSLINVDIPSGSLAGGIPVRVIKENYLPRILSEDERSSLVLLIESQCKLRPNFNKIVEFSYAKNELRIKEEEKITFFYLQELAISGDVTSSSIIVKDQLRRNGIRFRYEEVGNSWKPWKI
jgi:hypothetical protein